MCGFLMVLSRGRPVDMASFGGAFTSMRHRGPDYQRIETGEVEPQGDRPRIYFAAGHHRLSILDLDPRSHQPFGDDDALMVYNGEVYDYQALRAASLFDGYGFSTSGDTEVVFEGLRREGPAFMRRANGMWSLAVMDRSTGNVVASRDRYGKKPLFLHRGADVLILSSTIGAIYRYLRRPVQLDLGKVQDFLVYGACFPSDGLETAHRDISQVPPSTSLVFDAQAWSFTVEPYFDLGTAPMPSGGEVALAELLADSFAIRLNSDRPVALLLSGGIDSSLLLSIATHRGLVDRVQCFIGDTGQSDDAHYANKCAAQLGVRAETIKLGYGSETFARFLAICRHQEKPFQLLGNSMAMAQMYETVAARGIPVVLDGSGGDEVFGGYWNRQFGHAVSTALRDGDGAWLGRSFLANMGNPDRYIRGIRAMGNTPAVTTDPGRLVRYARSNGRLVRDADPLADRRLNFDEALVADATRGQLGEWVWQNDRNAMMHSVENRSPLLDYRLAPFLRSGYREKFVRRYNKYELRRAFDSFVPLPTQWRVQKQGFRWSRERFLHENAGAVIDLIAATPGLDDVVEMGRLVDDARRDAKVLDSRIVQGLLSVAGVTEAMRF